MKKNKTYLFILVLLGLFNSTYGQYQCNNNDVAPGATQDEQALNTYWHYRYRLVKYFMTLGSDVGMSIPADIRNAGDDAVGGNMQWTDGPRLIGWYLETLATEYKLLKNNGATSTQLQETVTELFYALHALYRLDSIYVMDCYNQSPPGPSNKNVSQIVCNGFNAPNVPFPGFGIMPPDDIQAATATRKAGPQIVAQTDPLNAGLPIFPYNQYNGVFGTIANPYGQSVAEFGSGAVGPITTLNGTDPGQLGVASKDDYMASLMGLAMVITLVNESSTDPYHYGKTPQAMAQALATAFYHYIFDISQLQLVGCNDQEIFPQPNQGPWSNYFFWPYASPLQSLANKLGIPIVIPSSSEAISQPGVAAYWPNFSSEPQNIINYAWSLEDPCYAVNTSAGGGCSLTGIELAEMGVTMGNNGANYSSPCDMISSLGSWGGGGCFLGCSGNGGNTINTGWDIYYGAINNVLYGTQCSCVDLCKMRDLIYSAPYHGPFAHTTSTPSSNLIPDYNRCGWASSRRFGNNENQDFNGDLGNLGNFNGLDYMLLFNLYYLVSEQQTYPQIITVNDYSYSTDGISSTINGYPDVYPYNYTYVLGWTYVGTQGNPYIITANDCAPIYINQLSVNASTQLQSGLFGVNTSTQNGDLIIEGGASHYIDFNPKVGQLVDVQSGANLTAYCDLNCCTVTPPFYKYQSDPGSNDDASIRPAYKKTTEFDTINGQDAIRSYPNPFQNQISVEFFLHTDENASIYIADIAGRKIVDIVKNQQFQKGTNIINYNGSNLTTGSYFCILETGKNRQISKMIKVR